MKKVAPLLILALSLGIISCNNQNPTVEKDSRSQAKALTPDEVPLEDRISVNLIVETLNNKRKAIEQNLPQPISISSSDLREKVKQKWRKIDFYQIDNEVVRIKSYPYTEISKRTEEFYLEKGELFMAIIEDNGEGERGKSLQEFDKIYYFHEGELIHEKTNEKEIEYSIKDSEGEELMQEVSEYLDIYNKRK
ncbi:hypothetical protein SAMN05216474_0745 [Lishizhenia tianjinensis]|uniref:Lipoprotein n=1 Tax=Lishizhenia tianjinensis TaxID=477690 RepID=A0A1I6Y9W8_9FLAO|nr:hypothetical protein [Lishizhenia tianjinensis]SFT47157.1 hypothetical protein SAMN05216474_0745 [Lishizhenia tianjinensis]